MIVVCECGIRGPANNIADLMRFLLPPGHGHVPQMQDGTDRYVPGRIIFMCPCGEKVGTVFNLDQPAGEITAWLNFHIMNHRNRPVFQSRNKGLFVVKSVGTAKEVQIQKSKLGA